jgi:hypothetical protein
MANDVFANGREISCKAAAGKTICAIPDVCFTPPENPTTPPGVPIPYPNTGFASDTTKGSKKVKISDKECGQKNKSHFKKSIGDEAGCAAKKGIITSKNRGKVYFNSWSMDVKIEGKNVPRHLDLTTNNHASFPGDTPTWPYIDTIFSWAGLVCAKDMIKERWHCRGKTPYGNEDPCPPGGYPRTYDDAAAYADNIAANKCLAARRCMLVPYSSTGEQPTCCPGETPHHLVEASGFFDRSRDDPGRIQLAGTERYETDKAPCICATGINNNHGTHGIIHTFQSCAMPHPGNGTVTLTNGSTLNVGGKDDCLSSYGEARDQSAEAVSKTFPESGCSEACIKAQLDAYHKSECGMNDDTEIRGIKCGTRSAGAEAAAEQSVAFRSQQVQRLRSGAPPLPRPPAPPRLR